MTDMLKSLINPSIKKELEELFQYKESQPCKKQDVILFLVSEMSNYVAGAAIDSNGGQF